MRNNRFCSLVIFFMLSFCGSVLAQTVPAGQDVGAQGQRFGRETAEKERRIERREKKAAELEVQEPAPQKPLAGESTFILKDVKLTGVTVFKQAELAETYKDSVGKSITFNDLESIVGKIKAKYKIKGYLTTSVFIPEQEIQAGIVEIRIIEGKMGKLKIEGNKHFSTKVIAAQFSTKAGQPLNMYTALKDILRLNRNSDLHVKTVVSAGEAPGTSDVVIKVQDKRPWHVGVMEDNTGTRLTGAYRTGVSLRSTNATGHMDTVFLNTVFSKLTQGYSVIYRLPIDSQGTKLGLDMTYFHMRLGKEYRSSAIKGTTMIMTPYLMKELYLSETTQVNATVGIEAKSVQKWAKEDMTANDQLRVPFVALDFSKDDAWGQTTFSPRLSAAVKDLLGASDRKHLSASRPGTGGHFVKYEQSLTRIQRMLWGSYSTLHTQVQLSSYALPPSEQMQIGGMNSVRGYPEGDYMADNGVVVNFDWLFPMYLIPKTWKLPHQDVPLQRQIMPVFFVDYGAGKLKNSGSGELGRKNLLGAGAGVRVRLSNSASLRLEWAKDLQDNPVTGSGPSTFYLQAQAEF